MLSYLEQFNRDKFHIQNSLHKLNYIIDKNELDDVCIYGYKDRCIARVQEGEGFKKCGKVCKKTNKWFCNHHCKEKKENKIQIKEDYYTKNKIKYEVNYNWEEYGIYGIPFVCKIKDVITYKTPIPFWLDYRNNKEMLLNDNFDDVKFYREKKNIRQYNKLNKIENKIETKDMLKKKQKKEQLYSLFNKFLKDQNYKEYVENNNFVYTEDIIKDFVSKHNLMSFINVEKLNKKTLERFENIINEYESIYKLEENEDDSIESRFKKYKKYKQKNKNEISELEKWWENCDKIKIKDRREQSSIILALELNESEDDLIIYDLYNSNKQKLGEVLEWYDEENIPSQYKFKNIVQQLDSSYENYGMPLYQYILYKKSELYHNLPKLVYTKFRYNKEKEIMQPTNEIIEIKKKQL